MKSVGNNASWSLLFMKVMVWNFVTLMGLWHSFLSCLLGFGWSWQSGYLQIVSLEFSLQSDMVFHSCIFWHFLGCCPGLLCEVIYWTMVLINPSYCTQEWFKWRAIFRPGVEAWSLTWKVLCCPGINKKLEVETMCRYAHALRHSPQIQDFIPVTLYISSGLDPIIIYLRFVVLDLTPLVMIISIC
jgi:hypothetical protein